MLLTKHGCMQACRSCSMGMHVHTHLTLTIFHQTPWPARCHLTICNVCPSMLPCLLIHPPTSSGAWHVGCRPLYSLLPRGLLSRTREERRKGWDQAQRGCMAAATEELAR